MWISYAKKIGYVIALLLGFSLIVWLAIYWQERTWLPKRFQQIALKVRKSFLIGVNMGQWEEDVSIRHQHHTYQYIYNMSWQDKRVSLRVLVQSFSSIRNLVELKKIIGSWSHELV